MQATPMESFEQIVQRSQQKAVRRLQQQKIAELVGLIDELSGEMGVPEFRDAVRIQGYDIDACLMTLQRRGISH